MHFPVKMEKYVIVEDYEVETKDGVLLLFAIRKREIRSAVINYITNDNRVQDVD